MKYYVIEIAEGDDKIKGKAIYEDSSMEKALAKYHKKMGTAMDSELYNSELIVVIDEDGNIVKYPDKFTRKTESEITNAE